MALDRKHKAFRFEKAMFIDANNLLLEQALLRFLMLVRAKGMPITVTKRDAMTGKRLAELVASEPHFSHFGDTPERLRLVEKWIERDFTTVIREGKERGGAHRIANAKPLHMSAIKLLDPRIRSQDREAGAFLFNVFRDNPVVMGEDSLLLGFLTAGTRQSGEYDLQLDEATAGALDVETLFLLRMLHIFQVDRPDLRRRVSSHEFICPGHRDLIVEDALKLLAYREYIPRRELVQYLLTLFGFHLALYCIKSFAIVTHLAEAGQYRCQRCQSRRSPLATLLNECAFRPRLFVDLTAGGDRRCRELAQAAVARDYSLMTRYIRAHFKLKKLDEFASTMSGQQIAIEHLPSLLKHRDLDGYFRAQLNDLLEGQADEERDPETQAILGLGLSPLDSYAEIVHQKTIKTRLGNHRKLMSSLCGINSDSGFLAGGRGRRRSYVLGNELLEVLVQLAVLTAKKGQLSTTPITITDFVRWLADRYGILIDATGEPLTSPDVAQALETNYRTLKERLREIGFFVDLSDASNSQVITPRFPIADRSEP